MAYYAKDPELNRMANELQTITWHTALSEDEKNEVKEMAAGRLKTRYVYSLPDYKTWAIRFYLGGEQRTVGHILRDQASALRYADMVSVYFWRYRVRGAAEPTIDRLNFSLERAKADLANEPDVVGLITRIEAYFKSQGVIRNPREVEQERRDKKEVRERKRTARGHFLEMELKIEKINARLEESNARLEESNDRLARIEQHLTQPFIQQGIQQPQIWCSAGGQICNNPPGVPLTTGGQHIATPPDSQPIAPNIQLVPPIFES